MSSTSANTGTAPAATTAFTVAMKVKAGTMTSSPGSTPSAASAQRSAAVPLATATPKVEPSDAARGALEVGDGAGRVVALVAEERAARDDRRDGVGFLLAEERGALREVERHGRHRRCRQVAQPTLRSMPSQ